MPKEHCVMCGNETNVDVSTHVDLRTTYVEGVGQFCTKCYSKGSITEDYQAPKVEQERIETKLDGFQKEYQETIQDLSDHIHNNSDKDKSEEVEIVKEGKVIHIKL